MVAAQQSALAAASPEANVSAGLFDQRRLPNSVAVRNGNAIVVWTDNGTGLAGNPDPQPPLGAIDVLRVAEGAAARLTINSAAALSVGPNINLSRMPGRNTAESIAIDPTSTNFVVAVGIAGNDQDFGGRLMISSSRDGGQTFITQASSLTAAASPRIAFDDFGNCFLAYRDHATIDPFEPSSKLLVSTDRCITFREVFDAGFAFSEALAAGPQGAVFTTLLRGSSAGSITLLATRGLGVVDTPVTRASVGGTVAIGPDGQIALGGGKFVTVDADGFGPGGFGPQVLLSDTAADVALAYDRSESVHRGRLYALYGSGDVVFNDRRMLLRFSDDGSRFSTAQQVNTLSPPRQSPFPSDGRPLNAAVSIDPARGTLVGAWQVVSTDNTQASQRLRFRQVARAFAPPINAGPLPESPTDFRSLSAVPGRVELVWTDRADDETEYQLLRNVADGFELLATLPPNTTRFVDVMSSGVNNLPISYALRTVNAAGRSESTFVNVVTAAVPPPPAGATATALSSSQITVTWRDTGSVENRFIVERSTNGVDFTLRAEFESFSTSFTDENLTPATRFFYRVRAANNRVLSEPSNVANATTLDANGPIAAPTQLTANAPSAASVTLRWVNSSNDGRDIEIQRSTDARRFTSIARTDGLVTVFFDRTVARRTTYFYRIRALNAQRVSEFSNIAQVTTPRR